MLDTCITLALYWLAIGAVIWMFMFSQGLIAEARANTRARGYNGVAGIILAQCAAVIFWPVIVWAFCSGFWLAHFARRGGRF